MNGQIEVKMNGHVEKSEVSTSEKFEVLINGNCEAVKETLPVAKSSKKKVSFHDNVTDIDADCEAPITNTDYVPDNLDEAKTLRDILNISEKINFFKNAFSNGVQTIEDNGHKPHGHQSSIPEARLAFVAGMVDRSLTGNNSRADKRRNRVDSDVTNGDGSVTKKDEEDTEPKTKSGFVATEEVSRSPEVVRSSEGDTASDMAATEVTYLKVFATQKNKNGFTEPVVDTSSILEHREELRELWEKRMMADENQSSSSSTVAETTTKPVQEDDNEEQVAKSKSESDTNLQPKMANGVAKPIEDNKVEETGSTNSIHEEQAVKSSEVSPVAATTEVDHENNNNADSLDEDNNNDDYIEEKTYTSKLETSLVTKQVTQVSTETVVHSTTVEEQHVSEIVQESLQAEACSDQTVTSTVISTTFEKCDSQEAEINSNEPESLSAPSEEVVSSTEEVITEREVHSGTSEEIVVHEETITSASQEVIHQQVVVETVTEGPVKSPEPERLVAEDDDDGFVRVEECLPQPDSTEDVQDLPSETVGQDTIADEQEITTTNGYDEHSRPSTTSPDLSIPEDKPSHPEMEQFVKSGGLKRILPGVQKTEQPYNTCTTETKIAMEIREMREREEELRLMREQALLSPVVSPVPPKSPNARSPSPSQKEVHSPTPSSVGYRVSSVFGHKGTTSPSPPADEEKKPFKGFSKESAVEKEIRIARDREEELRRQKGLPPREDDSYVKPSQVKNSQVRVFGKMAGTSNTSVKQAATAKIQMEIEEQTQREMALRETGHIQTISQERTDAKVAKMKTPDCTSPVTNGNSHPLTNGNYTNGRSSPDKRSTPSPTGAKPATIFSQNNGVPKGNISMHKFIASKGKETTFTASRNGGVFQPKEEVVTKAAVPPPMIKLKRNLSVESKIQQEILEMKQREEELKKLHMNRNNENSTVDGKDIEHEMNQKNNFVEYENGNGLNEEEISPRHNKLIAQWEQRIQKAES